MSLKLGQRFKSFSDFQEAFKRFQDEQHVPFSVLSSTSAKYFNKQKEKELSAVRLKEDLKWKDAKLGCKHYGPPRHHPHKEGTKARPIQHTFKVGCSAHINVCSNVQTQELVITSLNTEHTNHPMLENLKHNYPEFRRVPPELLPKAEEMFDYEVKPRIIRDAFHRKGIKLNRQDICNLRDRWKSKKKPGDNSDMENLWNELEELKKEDPESEVAIVYDNDTMEVVSIFLQFSNMKKHFKMYPELLIMDTTYSLNVNQMPLIDYAVIDRYGSTRIVGYTIISSERADIVTQSLKSLVEGCDNDVLPKVKTVMLDKDQSEIASVKAVIPHADIHLCDFHVKQQIRLHGSKEPNWEDVVEDLVDDMIHAHTEEDYQSAYDKLQESASSTFFEYFDKFWHSCKHTWVNYQRNTSFNLGVKTTGHIESHHDKIKKIVTRKLKMWQMVRKLRILHKINMDDEEYQDFQSLATVQYKRDCKDPIVNVIFRDCTQYVAKLLEKQYRRSLEPPSQNAHETSHDSCDCKFFSNYRLPCAHIFRLRQSDGIEIFDLKLIPQRWSKLEYEKPITIDPEVENDPSIKINPLKVCKKPKVLSSEDRYNKVLKIAQDLAEDIASLAANFGGDQYKQKIATLQTLKSIWERGEDAVVLPVDAEGRVNPDFVIAENRQTKPLLKESEKELIPEKETSSDHSNNIQNKNVITLEIGTDLPLLSILSDGPAELKELTADEVADLLENDRDVAANIKDLKAGNNIETQSTIPFLNLDPSLKAKLKLRPSLKVKGNPKGKRKPVLKRYRKKKIENAKKALPFNEEDQIPTNEDSPSEEEILKPSCTELLDDGNDDILLDAFSSSFGEQIVKEIVEEESTSYVDDELPFKQCTADNVDEDEEDANCNQDKIEGATPEITKICFACNKPAALRTAQTLGNFGRQYYCCSNPESEACKKFFNWASKKKAVALSPDDLNFPSGVFPLKKSMKSQKLITQFISPSKEQSGTPTSSTLCEVPNEVSNTDELDRSVVLCKCEKPAIRYRPVMGPNLGKTVYKCKSNGCSFYESCIQQDSQEQVHASSDNAWEEEELPWHASPKHFPSLMASEAVRIGQLTFTKSSFDSITPMKWLHDNVIDVFSSLIVEFAKAEMRDLEVKQLGCISLENTSLGLTVYLDMAKKEPWLMSDLWLIPTRVNRNHWVLFLVLVRKKTVLILDSRQTGQLSTSMKEQLNILLYLISESHKNVWNVPPNWRDWSIHAPLDVGVQENDCDCGIFVCSWIYALFNKVPFPPNLDKYATNVRSWIASYLWSKAEPITLDTPPSDDDDDVAVTVLSTVDNMVQEGTLIIQKPWESITLPDICLFNPPDTRTTSQYLSAVLDELWVAKGDKCGAPNQCRVKKGSHPLMHLCEICRDWFHLLCVGDQRQRPDAKKPYLCPLHHSSGRSASGRALQRPLRLRRSID